MSSQLLSIGGWWILPKLATGWLQTLYYRLTIRAGDPIPQPGHPVHNRHRRNIFVFVIISYLLYTIYEADWQLQLQGDFYRDLGVPFEVEDRRIQSRFRRLTVQYHPDKLDNATPEQRAVAEAFYIHLKQAKDTLVDPAKRYAYERFGPDILQWRHCSTIMDFVQAGALRMIPHYAGSALTLVFFSFFGYMEFGRYWQYLTIFALAVFECHTITRPEFPLITRRFINPVLATFGVHAPYLPFQTIAIARKIALSFFIAVAQIAPQFRSNYQQDDSTRNLAMQADQVMGMTRTIDRDARRLLELELTPFTSDSGLEGKVKSQLQAWLAANEVRTDPGVQVAVQKVLQRRNTGEASAE